jgi:hypothetical protein
MIEPETFSGLALVGLSSSGGSPAEWLTPGRPTAASAGSTRDCPDGASPAARHVDACADYEGFAKRVVGSHVTQARKCAHAFSSRVNVRVPLREPRSE